MLSEDMKIKYERMVTEFDNTHYGGWNPVLVFVNRLYLVVNDEPSGACENASACDRRSETSYKKSMQKSTEGYKTLKKLNNWWQI